MSAAPTTPTPATRRASRMLIEAGESPDRVRAQFARNAGLIANLGGTLRRLAPYALVTCARGSSDHAATYLRYLAETRLRLLTSSLSPSVSSVYGVHQDLHRCVFLALSQAGAPALSSLRSSTPRTHRSRARRTTSCRSMPGSSKAWPRPNPTSRR